MAEAFEERVKRGGGKEALEELGRFFMNSDPVHLALNKVVSRLNSIPVPYAVAGAMALNAHGFRRATVDVDLLVTPEGLKKIHESLEGLGYLPPFTGSKQLRDTEYGVKVEFLVTGHFPGDGKPKPVAFPDPAHCAIEMDGIRYVQLPTLIELKLASGMTNAGRLKDLADVQELIRVLNLADDYAKQLNPYVRKKFKELWKGVRNDTAGET